MNEAKGMTEERIVYLNQVASEAIQGQEKTMTVATEDVQQLTSLARRALAFEWISVEDRLPNIGLTGLQSPGPLIGYHPDWGRFMCDFNGGEWHTNTASPCVPTHFMPLPPAPEGRG